MSRLQFLSKRVLFAVVALYLILSVTFGLVTLTANPKIARIAYSVGHSPEAQRANATERAAMVEEAISEYKAEHGLDRPLAARYVDWMVDVTTLDWGQSRETGEPVTTLLASRLSRTLAWVLPAILFALLGSLVVGLYAATHQGAISERAITAVVYVAFGLPNFWLAVGLYPDLVTAVVPLQSLPEAFVAGWYRPGLATLAMGTSLFAIQVRYVRTQSREYLFTEFVKVLRAKGVSTVTVARHLLRNAAVPLASLFVADLLGVLVVEVFVLEEVLGIRGIGTLGIRAIRGRDLPVVLGIAFVIAAVGVVGNLLSDLVYGLIDPRVEVER
jgi:peptide/nickel transport system permease protein